MKERRSSHDAAGRRGSQAPKTTASQAVWAQPLWQDVPGRKKKTRFVRGEPLRVTTPQAGRSTTVWNSWGALAAEDGDDHGWDAEAEEVAHEGPTPAEAAQLLRASRRLIAQVKLKGVAELPANEETRQEIATLSAEITTIDHETHSAKPVRAQLRSLEQRRARADAKAAKSCAARIAAVEKLDAARAEHGEAEQQLMDDERHLAALDAEYEKMLSLVEAEDAAAPGGHMEVEPPAASEDISAWTFEMLQRQQRRILEQMERLACRRTDRYVAQAVAFTCLDRNAKAASPTLPNAR